MGARETGFGDRENSLRSWLCQPGQPWHVLGDFSQERFHICKMDRLCVCVCVFVMIEKITLKPWHMQIARSIVDETNHKTALEIPITKRE